MTAIHTESNPIDKINEQYFERVQAALTIEEWKTAGQIAKAARTNPVRAKGFLVHLCRIGTAEMKWRNSGAGASLRGLCECFRRVSNPKAAP